MDVHLIALTLLVIVSSLSCDETDKESIFAQFSSAIDNIVRNNKLVFEVNVKGNSDSLRSVYVRETQQNMELLLAQFVDKYEDKAGEMEEIMHNAITEASVKIGADIDVQRKCLLLLLLGMIRNEVNEQFFQGREQREPRYKKMITKVRQKTNTEKRHRKHVGAPPKMKPKVSELPKDYKGYAIEANGYPVMIVPDKVEECSTYYVVAFDESLQDLITDEVNSYLAHYKYRAKMKVNINQFLPTLKTRCKTYIDQCFAEFENCTEVIDAMEIVVDQYESKLEATLMNAVKRY